MSISLYDVSIPLFARMLGNLSKILAIAAAQAEQRKIDPAVLIGSRLAPDMFPLSRQVQIASDAVKGAAARLAGLDIPSYEDSEQTFAELQDRITKTLTFVTGITPEQLTGSEVKPISLKVGGQELSFTGLAYLTDFVLPNLFFHVTTTYAILRHNGIDLGKKDFLGMR